MTKPGFANRLRRQGEALRDQRGCGSTARVNSCPSLLEAKSTIAYIANQFPSPLEPYVMDEIGELRRRGVRVICCSGKRVAQNGLTAAECAFQQETRYIRPLPPWKLARAVRRLISERESLEPLCQSALEETAPGRSKRLRVFAHTVLGAALANELTSYGVEHIHAHHGYYGSWMALIASRLLGVGFSFTLHGSDLVLRGDLLATKLRFCHFCVTVSDFNREFILRKCPSIPAEKIIVQRLGVDPVDAATEPAAEAEQRPVLLSVGRLHRVKNFEFLIQACAALRNEGRDFQCWIAGDGPERLGLERWIRRLDLEDCVRLLGQVPRAELSEHYRRADLVVLTSRSEGIPVVLMEAMAHGKLVLAPAITGIPELVQHGFTGFLYESGSRAAFLSVVRWILDHRSSLDGVRRGAKAIISTNYRREQNLHSFADHFLARTASWDDDLCESSTATNTTIRLAAPNRTCSN